MIVQRAMGALAIVERFDVVEDLGSGLGESVKATAIDQFQFEGGPEAFHGGIVIAVDRAEQRFTLGWCPASREGRGGLGRWERSCPIPANHKFLANAIFCLRRARRRRRNCNSGYGDRLACSP